MADPCGAAVFSLQVVWAVQENARAVVVKLSLGRFRYEMLPIGFYAGYAWKMAKGI